MIDHMYIYIKTEIQLKVQVQVYDIYSDHYLINRLNAAFTRTHEHRNALLIFKRNHVAAASQQKQVLVRLTGILQAFLTYEKKVELLMELMS